MYKLIPPLNKKNAHANETVNKFSFEKLELIFLIATIFHVYEYLLMFYQKSIRKHGHFSKHFE